MHTIVDIKDKNDKPQGIDGNNVGIIISILLSFRVQNVY